MLFFKRQKILTMPGNVYNTLKVSFSVYTRKNSFAIDLQVNVFLVFYISFSLLLHGTRLNILENFLNVLYVRFFVFITFDKNLRITLYYYMGPPFYIQYGFFPVISLDYLMRTHSSCYKNHTFFPEPHDF